MWADKDLIIYCNITLLSEEVVKGKRVDKEILLKEIVTKNIGEYFNDTLHQNKLDKYKVKLPLKVIKVEIISTHGYSFCKS